MCMQLNQFSGFLIIQSMFQDIENEMNASRSLPPVTQGQKAHIKIGFNDTTPIVGISIRSYLDLDVLEINVSSSSVSVFDISWSSWSWWIMNLSAIVLVIVNIK